MKRKKRLTKRQRKGAIAQAKLNELARGVSKEEGNAFADAVKAELAAHYAGALAAVKAWTP